MAEHLALVGKGNLLLHRDPDPKELAHFIEGAAEARGLGHTSEPTHGGRALFDATVILFLSIVEGAGGPVEPVIAERLADGTRVGVMAIGRHPFWGVTNHPNGLRRSKRLAASISRFSLTIESTRLPSRSMARERSHHFPLTLTSVSSTYQDRASLTTTSFCPQLVYQQRSKQRG